MLYVPRFVGCRWEHSLPAVMPNIETIQLPMASMALDRPADEVVMSPLDVLFSQNVIYPKFTDGKSVDDASRQIKAVPRQDEAANGKDEEVFLDTPFPTIQAVRWCPKLRDGNGKPLPDGNGGYRMGAEGLFTVDNRRLYALQRAAVAQWPKKCVAYVEVISDKNEVMKHLKKFRTRTNGLSITISEWNGVGRDNSKDFSAMRVWDWRSAVSSVEAGGAKAALDAADSGSIGCWQYLDNQEICRGPFSNWQMRQWWELKMLPPDLRIRPYDAAAACEHREGDWATVLEHFAGAPEPFAPGWSPRATEQEGTWHKCAQCNRRRWEGWEAHGEWYCAMCWKRWQKYGDRERRHDRRDRGERGDRGDRGDREQEKGGAPAAAEKASASTPAAAAAGYPVQMQ